MAMRGMDFIIKSPADLIEAINKYGFLPYFRNSIEGFSIEEHIEPRYWFGDEEGAWEWKGSVIQKTSCAYGKFFEHKAVYISKEWFPDFAKNDNVFNSSKHRYIVHNCCSIYYACESE